MICRQLKCFMSYENYIQLLRSISTIIFVSGFSNDCWCASLWQWQIGALAVFLAWFSIIVLLKDMPWAGIPINMLFNIIKTFNKPIFMPVLLIVAFSICCLFAICRSQGTLLYVGVLLRTYNNVEHVIQEEGLGILITFSSPYQAVAKIIMQTAGELDYETMHL